MEYCCDTYLDIRTDDRLIIDLEPVICAIGYDAVSVIEDTIERITHIKTAAIFKAASILHIIVWHHIGSEKEIIPYSDIPVLYIQIYLSSVRKDIMSHIRAVMLHALKPSGTQRQGLQTCDGAEVSLHIRIDKYIIDYAMNSIGLVYRDLISRNSTDYASAVQKKIGAAEKALEELVDIFHGANQ